MVPSSSHGGDADRPVPRRVLTGGNVVLRPLIRPVELSPGRRWQLADGTDVATDDVFDMFVAAREGDIATVDLPCDHPTRCITAARSAPTIRTSGWAVR